MATDKVTNPSNASVPVLSSHQAVADAAETKHLADSQLLEAAAGTLAPSNTSTSTTRLTMIDKEIRSNLITHFEPLIFTFILI